MTDPLIALAVVAVDAVKGTIAERLLEPAVAPVWEVLKPIFFPWWDPALHEIHLRLREGAEELRQKDASVVQALERGLERGEADALATGFLRAAAQATTEERMRMLAAAAAGVFTPDLDSEMRSRVSRAIMQLEPSDVVELRKLDEGTRAPGIREGPMMTREREPLVVAGCIVDESMFAGHTIRITTRGNAVLTTLRAWAPR